MFENLPWMVAAFQQQQKARVVVNPIQVGSRVELIRANGQIQGRTDEKQIVVPVGTIMEVEMQAGGFVGMVAWVCVWLGEGEFERRGVFDQTALKVCEDQESTLSVVG